jgi:[ribosomal protein S5]-alanine N-acetyltransferase
MPLGRPQDMRGPRSAANRPVSTAVVTTDWRDALPVLNGTNITLREMRTSDAPSLFALLTTEEVARFISPPPGTVEGFERFIAWAARQRAAGAYACFAVTVADSDTAVGIFQLRSTEPGFVTAEWGFAIGSPFWGSGLFEKGARLVMEFAFETVGVHRLEARAAVRNGRGNGALRKIGAVQEGILRKSFLRDGEYHDQMLWTVLDEDWRAKAIWGGGRMILH